VVAMLGSMNRGARNRVMGMFMESPATVHPDDDAEHAKPIARLSAAKTTAVRHARRRREVMDEIVDGFGSAEHASIPEAFGQLRRWAPLFGVCRFRVRVLVLGLGSWVLTLGFRV